MKNNCLSIMFQDNQLPLVEIIQDGVHTSKFVSYLDLLGAMAAHGSIPVKYTPVNMVATNGYNAYVYYVPPMKRSLLLGDVHLDAVPLPGMIVALKGEPLSVKSALLTAFKGESRPDEQTQLFNIPTPNVNTNGSVCWGSATISQYSLNDYQGVLSEFFNSAFSDHSGINVSKRYPDDVRKLLIEIKGYNHYPEDDLTPFSQGVTLGEFVERLG